MPGLFRFGDTRHTVSDIPALNDLGWAPTVPLEQSIADYLEWIRSQPDVRAESFEQADAEMRRQHVLQHIAAFGGFTCLEIDTDGWVQVEPLGISFETAKAPENDIPLFYTGMHREGLDILAEQNRRPERDDEAVVRSLHAIKEIGFEIRRVLRAGDVTAFGRLLDDYRRTKKGLSGEISNDRIDRWYALARDHGALGGKIMGAGGGGFFMFCAPGDKTPLRHAMSEAGLVELNVRFDLDRSKVLVDI